ncbi:hypothetical protein BA059_10040 [Mycolicibacterium sp. (ex Dasyatis americana)]|nr:hypothetical protein BA059_10040 [Mycolicibacterium sp. (ex Dasyatis americana)]
MTVLTIPEGSDPLILSAESALASFDELPPCPASVLRGWWAGREVHTGHPLDGVLANVSWYGKRFDEQGAVHPLVVSDSAGNPYPLNPSVVPYRLITHPISTPAVVKRLAPGLMTALRPLVRARQHGARLGMAEYRGVVTATMTYLDRPIVDVFRKVDDDTVLGSMDYRGMSRPSFFVLQRDSTR